ncbi:unnamed protein product [Linum tenue]|uniref:F-box domain-containing protein n=1 Tax=Linum tenue TaxID=586396 RepID=A0AAV0QRP3_9ROSI|nr:unnamed protein product [Linum tenue]
MGDDLLVEILIRGLRNPRSACSSKLVCKRWSSLISGPRFNRRFVSHHRDIMNRRPMPDDPLELLRIIRSFLPPMPKGVADALRVLDCNKGLGFMRGSGRFSQKSRQGRTKADRTWSAIRLRSSGSLFLWHLARKYSRRCRKQARLSL